jgi:hypothetical protein
MIAALAADPFTARTTWPLSDRQRMVRAYTGRIRRREVRPMPLARSADPISVSETECPLRPPNQQSLTREDKDVHCFSLESLIVYPIAGDDRVHLQAADGTGFWYGQTPRLPD